MDEFCTIQAFFDNDWRDIASVTLSEPMNQGWQAATYTGYETSHAFENMARRDVAALSWSFPVGLEPIKMDTWPAFLLDLLPQGFGRRELLKQLGQSETARGDADWTLLNAGAGNPVGHLRIKEARTWLDERVKSDLQGFTFDEVAARGESFTEYLAQHGLLAAGSSGVQGEWPKILLTQGHDGLLYLDHALADHDAAAHFLVKFARGANQALSNILRLEAPYMQFARHLGLKVHADLELRDRALFIPRFDRRVTNGRVERLAQESLAALCDMSGFGVAPSHNVACSRLVAATTNPEAELIEYLKRDIANVALGNKDNHARNTALQRGDDGVITLTPVFDFAPMALHPDGIARRMRWESDDGGSPRWASIVQQAIQATGIGAAPIVEALREMAAPMQDLLQFAQHVGIDREVLQLQAKTITNIAEQLAQL